MKKKNRQNKKVKNIDTKGHNPYITGTLFLCL